MSVNIINVDGKCITRVMRDFADFLAKSCCKAEGEGKVPGVRSTVCSEGMEGEDVCGLGRSASFFPSEDGWGPDLKELQTMIETLKVSHDLEIEAVVTSNAQEIEALKTEVMGECERLGEMITELENQNANLEDVISGLASDVLLNNKEIESLKLHLTEKDEDVEDESDDETEV